MDVLATLRNISLTIHKSHFYLAFCYDTNHVSVFLSQLNGEEATVGTYSGFKMAAGRYQRAMQQFTSALQGGGLGTWLRKPPELGHFNISV